MSYATQADVEGYMGVTLNGDAIAISNLIANAERDIDSAVGGYQVDDATDRKFGDPWGTNVRDLSLFQMRRLRDAVAAQVEYRLQMGDDFFVEDQRDSTQGPDVTESGKVGRIGPRARAELVESGLLRLTGRAR